MFQREGKVVERRADGAVIRFSPEHCGQCRGCAGRSATSLIVDPVVNDEVRVSLSAPALRSILLNSLGWPLVGFVLAGVLAAILGLSDATAAALCLAGLMAGIFSCRALDRDTLSIEEVSHE